MAETDKKVIHNREEDNENNERDKKMAKNLEGDKMKSNPPSTGKSKERFSPGKRFHTFDDHKPDPRSAGKGLDIVPGRPNIIRDPNRLSKPDILEYATEAVKEYNKHQSKDKIELVNVKRAMVYIYNGCRYDLTFDAKVLADGEGERTHTYRASVWVKARRIEKVLYVKLVPDAQAKEKWWEKYSVE